MLETFTIETFSGRLGEAFRVEPDAGKSADLELVEVTDLTSRGGPEVSKWERAPFSLVFRGSHELALPQRVFRMAHPDIGSFEIFLVPLGPDAKGTRYEAIFT